MAVYTCEALVINSFNFQESDRLVKLLTMERGLVDAIVKGARKINSKKGGSLDLLNNVTLSIAEGRNLDIITDAKVIHDFAYLKKDLFQLNLAYYITELLNSSYLYGRETYSLYKEANAVLRGIENAGTNSILRVLFLKRFEILLLSELGFNIEHEARWKPGTPAVAALMDICLTGKWGRLSLIKCTNSDVRELANMVQSYSETVFEKKFKRINLLA